MNVRNFCVCLILAQVFLSAIAYADTLPDLTILEGSCAEHKLDEDDNAWDMTIFDRKKVVCTRHSHTDCRDQHFKERDINSLICVVDAVAEPRVWIWSDDLSRFGYQIVDENLNFAGFYIVDQDGRNHYKAPIEGEIYQTVRRGGYGWEFSPQGDYLVARSSSADESWRYSRGIFDANSGDIICYTWITGWQTRRDGVTSTCSSYLPLEDGTYWNPDCYYWDECARKLLTIDITVPTSSFLPLGDGIYWNPDCYYWDEC